MMDAAHVKEANQAFRRTISWPDGPRKCRTGLTGFAKRCELGVVALPRKPDGRESALHILPTVAPVRFIFRKNLAAWQQSMQDSDLGVCSQVRPEVLSLPMIHSRAHHQLPAQQPPRDSFFTEFVFAYCPFPSGRDDSTSLLPLWVFQCLQAWETSVSAMARTCKPCMSFHQTTRP